MEPTPGKNTTAICANCKKRLYLDSNSVWSHQNGGSAYCDDGKPAKPKADTIRIF